MRRVAGRISYALEYLTISGSKNRDALLSCNTTNMSCGLPIRCKVAVVALVGLTAIESFKGTVGVGLGTGQTPVLPHPRVPRD